MADLQHLVDDVLAVSAPGEGAEIALPAELDVATGTAHEGVGDSLVGDGELELVAADGVSAGAARLEAALDDLALVGFENYPLFLEIVEVASVDAGAIDEIEAEKDEERQCDYHHQRGDGYNLGFQGHLCHSCNILNCKGTKVFIKQKIL